MNIREALLLVRSKYLEEQNGINQGNVAEDYQRAIKEFPALMAVAHHLWANEVAKGLP